MEEGMASKQPRAWIGFWFHAPGLWLFDGFKMGAHTKRLNALYVAGTFVVMGFAYLLLRSWWAPLLAWSSGHLIWGWVLARRIQSGCADQ